MLTRLCVLFLAVTCVAGAALAVEMKEATGTVKLVELNGFTITDANARDLSLAIDKDTRVLAKGASHKMDRLKADGKLPTLAEFLAEKQSVYVKYWEKGAKLVAREVRVLDSRVP